MQLKSVAIEIDGFDKEKLLKVKASLEKHQETLQKQFDSAIERRDEAQESASALLEDKRDVAKDISKVLDALLEIVEPQ